MTSVVVLAVVAGMVVVVVEEVEAGVGVVIVVVVAAIVVVAFAELVGPSFEVVQAAASRTTASKAIRFMAFPFTRTSVAKPTEPALKNEKVTAVSWMRSIAGSAS